MVPYIPVHDVGGGWGGNGIQDSGNGTNPVAQLYRDKDDVRQNLKMLGNVFAEIYPIKNLTFRTSFGLEYGNFYTKDIVKRTYERAENVTSTGLNVNATQSYGWTWSNTLVYNKTFGEHAIKLLAGSEAIKYTQDGLATQNVNGFDFEDPIFINLNTDLASGFGVSSTQTTPTVLASYFGKVDYIYNDKYLVNATIRRDGYSGFASSQRYAVFPAFGVSWRLSEEDFMSNIDQISDFKIRAGWGQMGSQANVNPQNSFTLFGTHPGLGNYDITRNQSSLAVGYAPIFLGSTTTKWETSESKNIGVDLAFFNNKLEVNANYFVTDVKDLLVDLTRNGLESVSYGLPKVNRGKMQNKGFEIDVTTKGNITNDLRYNATLTFTRVKNKVVDIDGNPETFYSRSSSRLTDIIRTTPGQPMSSFYGYQRDGFFNTQEEVDALNQPDARIGSWKFKDQDGDGDIDGDDRVFIGSPQPKFVMGINLGLAWKNFDFNTFLVWNYGNDLFNYTKYFTEMRGFVGGVSRNVLRNGWTPENHNADLPYLAPGGQSGYSSFIVSSASDYYVEKGSFLRGRTLQLGYTLPASLSSKAKISRARIYFQAQNYFTITDYTGADPDISIQGGDINSGSADLFMGVDETSTPTPRQFLLGLNLTF
jgi:TonB-dependent starch-binding outer membrane protein SusC